MKVLSVRKVTFRKTFPLGIVEAKNTSVFKMEFDTL